VNVDTEGQTLLECDSQTDCGPPSIGELAMVDQPYDVEVTASRLKVSTKVRTALLR
jgi:hypothetical protein